MLDNLQMAIQQDRYQTHDALCARLTDDHYNTLQKLTAHLFNWTLVYEDSNILFARNVVLGLLQIPPKSLHLRNPPSRAELPNGGVRLIVFRFTEVFQDVIIHSDELEFLGDVTEVLETFRARLGCNVSKLLYHFADHLLMSGCSREIHRMAAKSGERTGHRLYRDQQPSCSVSGQLCVIDSLSFEHTTRAILVRSIQVRVVWP